MSAINGVMMQYFHWYTPHDGSLWREVSARAGDLERSNITALWLPPAFKGSGGIHDVGYGVYDLYDLGEFNQKGTVRTKYGTRDEYLSALASMKRAGLQAYCDLVLNHRMGGDESEVVPATPFYQNNRLWAASGLSDIKSFSRYTFPGRKGRYSSFTWDHRHFDAVDYDENRPDEHGLVYLFQGKEFDSYVALEKGNYAYLMGCDIDYQSQEVRDELTRWGRWYLDETGADGFRLDAIKHIAAWFFPQWLDEMERHAGRDLFVVGEYWNPDLATLQWYINEVGGRMSVFDVPLHFNFHAASRAGRGYDMRRLLDNTLMGHNPVRAVTFVENHDSQPLQALESPVEPWFKPLAYAFILLRSEGYPCIFGADYYGAEYADRGRDGNTYNIVMPCFREILDVFLQARRHYGHGRQYDYLDHPNTIGWTRTGDEAHPKAMAVIMGNGDDGYKWMRVDRPGARFSDATGHVEGMISANEHGWAEFRCRGGSVSVWVEV